VKRPRPRTVTIAAAALLTLGLVFFFAFQLGKATAAVPVQVYPAGATSARIVEDKGVVQYEVRDADGSRRRMQPADFAEAVWAGHQSRTLTQRLMLRGLNISSTATVGWVLLGLLGQVCFAGRMVIQWLASEKARASVIPASFWWMALAGASMLLVYFVWRKDVVGILGQATGWLIYTRNLYFIYIKRPADRAAAQATADAGPATDPA